MSRVSCENIGKTFQGARDIVALQDVTFTVNDGEFVALLGPSGCGKSTVLNILAGFERPSDGIVTIDGVAITKPGPDRGVVFQEAALFPWLSVWRNATFGPEAQGIPRSTFEPRARDILRLVGLDAFLDALPVQLSGGMRQRVGLARVLVMQPRALLMDEPFGALDAQTRLQMQQLLLDVWQSQRTSVLFVTHDIDEAILLADRVLIMSARPGRIARTISIALDRPRSIDSLTGSTFMSYKAQIMKEMDVKGVAHSPASPEHASG